MLLSNAKRGAIEIVKPAILAVKNVVRGLAPLWVFVFLYAIGVLELANKTITTVDLFVKMSSVFAQIGILDQIVIVVFSTFFAKIASELVSKVFNKLSSYNAVLFFYKNLSFLILFLLNDWFIVTFVNLNQFNAVVLDETFEIEFVMAVSALIVIAIITIVVNLVNMIRKGVENDENINKNRA